VKDFNLKKILIIICMVYLGLNVRAQVTNIDELSTWQLARFGRNAERVGDVYSAIMFYEKYYDIKKRNMKINYALASLYKETRNYEKAKNLYKHIKKKAPKKYPLAHYYYAQMLKATGNYDEAIEEFTRFRRAYRKDKKMKPYRRLARNDIAGCDSAKSIIEEPLNVSIHQLNSTVNGPHLEFSPIPFNDSMFFYASLKVDSLVYFNNSNVDTAMPVRKFYTATKEGLDWIGGKDFPLPFNREGVQTGNGVFSKDRKRFYFTRCSRNWQNKMICHIYQSKQVKGKWTKPVKLEDGINLDNYTSTMPALSITSKYDREILYFVSDRPEGRGGLDLWYSIWNPRRESFSEPRNLGYKINTPGDEITPYFDYLSRTLYFSSDGLPGIGGFDIFYSRGERKKWTDVKNLGSPMNSSYDDLYFTLNKSREDGFFTSNRPGMITKNNETCCDDIYYYRWKDFIHLDVTGKIYPFEKDKYGRKKDLSNFDFINVSDSIKPLDGAIVVLYMQDDELDELIMIDRDTTSSDGRYHFELLPEKNYKFDLEGFQYFNEEVHLSTEGINFSYTVEMPPIWVNVLTDKPVVLEDIYYEFNKTELTEPAKRALDTTLLVMLNEAPDFVVEIGAHTDSIGSTEYNMELSQDRAESVVKYLISKGIDAERLVAKGYGAQKPVAPNFLPDGSDNPEGRKKNRRTEFRVIGTLDDLKEPEFDEDFD
jgi:outer membrane protein OmpA-like peptidoglycan-associated protein/tetratricopeptide (TPR) repeat protein